MSKNRRGPQRPRRGLNVSQFGSDESDCTQAAGPAATIVRMNLLVLTLCERVWARVTLFNMNALTALFTRLPCSESRIQRNSCEKRLNTRNLVSSFLQESHESRMKTYFHNRFAGCIPACASYIHINIVLTLKQIYSGQS